MKARKNRMARSAIRRNKNSPNAKWRLLPATDAQWKVLRMVGRETGRIFPVDITRGEASEVLSARFQESPDARRAHKRAQRRRDQAA